jgi:hypothetical protein
MTPYEYALGLISILMSLALADIVVSFHRLVRSRAVVHWDGGRILVAAALVMLEIIRMWFAQWTGKDVAVAVTFGVYLGEFLQILLLVLLAYASLPDDVGEECDLKDFYEKNRRYFWLVFSAYQATYVFLWLTVFGGTQASVGGPVTAVDWFRMLGPLAVYLVLAFARLRWLDYAAPALVIVFYLLRYWNQSLAI